MLLDGDGSTSAPSFGGTQTLRIEPSAIPAALKAFTEAHDQVSRKITELSGLTIQPWAHDEVSDQTATRFAQRSQGAAADSAIECLVGYRTQLKAAITALQRSQAGYLRMEGTNATRWGKYD